MLPQNSSPGSAGAQLAALTESATNVVDSVKAVSAQDDGIVYFLAQQAGYGWPNAENKAPVPARPVHSSQLLWTAYAVDAHLLQYVPARWPGGYPCRLNLSKFGLVHFAETGPIAMRSIAFDVDDPVTHASGQPFREEWLAEEWPKIAGLRQHHPELVVYATRGGYRVVTKLPPGCVDLCSPTDVSDWKIFYSACLRYLTFFQIFEPRF